MVDEPHDVVKLLVARMKSHPEEFSDVDVNGDYASAISATHDRWWKARTIVQDFGSEADREALVAGMREVKLKIAHDWAMDELLNGPERRRKEQEEIESQKQAMYQRAQRNTMQMGQQALQQMAAQKYASQYGNAYPSTGLLGTSAPSTGVLGTSVTQTIFDEYTNLTRNTTSVADALQLGSEKLDESLLKKLKKAAGL